MKLVYLFSFFSFLGYNSKSNNKTEEITKNENISDIFSGNLVILLKSELSPNSNNIVIQDYIENGKSYIPIFTSTDKFNASTKGTVTNAKIEIQGIFLLSILNGNETLRLNPGLEDEKYFYAKELKLKYSKEISKLNLEFEKLSRK